MNSVIFVALGILVATAVAFQDADPGFATFASPSYSTESPENQTTNTEYNTFVAATGFPSSTTIRSDVMTNGICEEQKAIEARNKDIVMMVYQGIFGDHNIDATVDNFFRWDYIQHNPNITDGTQGIKDFARSFTQGQEKQKLDIRKISAEGDLVWLYLKLRTPEGKDLAVMDIFRVQDGYIAEHWDVIQEIPDLSTSRNPHPFF